VDLSEATGDGVILSKGALSEVVATNARLPGLDLREATLVGADFGGSQLAGARFEGATLSQVDFRGAQLDGARFAGTRLDSVDFRWSRLRGVDWSGSLGGESRWLRLTALLDRPQAFVPVMGEDLRESLLEDLESATLNLRGVVFRGAIWSGWQVGAISASKAVLENVVATNVWLGAGSMEGVEGASLRLEGGGWVGVSANGAVLTNSHFRGVVLSNSTFRGAQLAGTRFERCLFGRMDVSGADLTGAEFTPLDLRGVLADGTTVWTNRLRNVWQVSRGPSAPVNLLGLDLRGAVFRGLDLRGKFFNGCQLEGADFSGAQLQGSTFVGADIGRALLDTNTVIDAKWRLVHTLVTQPEMGRLIGAADLAGAYLEEVELGEARARGVILTGANLRGARLAGADLSAGNLAGTDLRGADVRATMFVRANLAGANLMGATGFLMEQEGVVLTGTVLPDGTVHP
jgi:uncharacterized protein YjbI with pentapeptide repeats